MRGWIGRLHVWYVSHSDAGLDVVATLQGAESKVYRALKGVVDGFVVLSTCNRFEVYADVGDPRRAREILGSALGSAARYLREARGMDAARRLARIAAGLESAILGEPEILGQVRSAWLKARDNDGTTRLLDMVFHAALRAGRRARLETRIGQGSLGYPSAAVRLASERLGGLDGRVVLVVGTGDAAASLTRIACSGQHGRPARLLVAGRNQARAADLARRTCGEIGDSASLGSASHGSYDVAFVAVSQSPTLSWLPERARLVVDISLPAAVPRMPNVVGLEEVAEYARHAAAARMSEVPRVERIIEEELMRLADKLREADVDPLIAAISSYASLLARSEAHRIARRLGLANNGEYIEAALSSYARKLLHPLFQALRDAARKGDAALLPRLLAEAYEAKLQGGVERIVGLVPEGKA